MGTVFRLTPGAWGAVRFAPSWLWETMLAIRTLTVRHHQAVHQPWLDRVDREAVGRAAPALAALIPRRAWTPDFLSPPRAPDAATFAEQLDAVRRTPPDRVAAELTRSLASHPSRTRDRLVRPLVEDPHAAREILADQLAAAFALLLEPFAGRLEDLLGGDVHRRGAVMATLGPVAAVAGIHPSVTADARSVRCAATDDVEVHCREFVLIPSVFVWPYPVAVVDSAVAALAYPVPGVAAVWEQPRRAPSALARVLGAGRADVLTALAEPTTTTTLAARLGVAPSTVSEHLTTLREAGLVRAERVGREVRYRRTEAATSLTSG